MKSPKNKKLKNFFKYFVILILIGTILITLFTILKPRRSVMFESRIEANTRIPIIENYEDIVKGKIAYNIPDSMKVGNEYFVKASITKSRLDSILFQTHENLSYTKVDDIAVGSLMKLKLLDPSQSEKKNFNITELYTNEEQLVDSFSTTFWEWDVIPLRSGENPLRLIATVRIMKNETEGYKNIEVYKKDIFVTSKISMRLIEFFNKHWKWLFSTLIIPFAIYLYKKRKRKP